MKRKPPQLDKPYPKHRHVLPEEAQAWREETGEKKKSLPTEAIRKHIPLKKIPSRVETIPSLPKPSSALQGPPAPRTLDAPLRAKIRKGKMAVEAVLDLHGHTRLTAYGVLLRFIAEAQQRGNRTVLVITGKGRGGGEKGILQEWLVRMVSEPPLKDLILACDSASPAHGGAGAWYLRLRKR